jgi:acyl-CoA synthetase (AMP-forming)/AMP-acid ligase II
MRLQRSVGRLEEPLTGRRWDREAILARVQARVAHYERRGLGPAERVFLHHGNTLEFFADLLAVWTLGGCAVPIDPRLTPFEVETLARAARPRFALCAEGLDPGLAARLASCGVAVLRTCEADAEGPDRSPSAPAGEHLHPDRDALILFTSGTTGEPKGVVHTHRSLGARWSSLEQAVGLEAFRRTLCILPTHFGHGLICNCLYPWLRGRDLCILPPFKPELVMRLGELLDEHEITFLSSVPSVWRLALKLARPPRRGLLERVFCGSAPLSGHLWKEIQDWTGTDAVWNAYGITETGSWLAGTTLDSFTPEDGLIGKPWGGEIRILETSSTATPPALARECAAGEPGYVWVNTPALMRGYLDRDDLTQEVVREGWFVTGDIGVADERGVLYLRGREREEINKGGVKVYPGDVDAVAERFAAVTDVCSFALDDPHYGQNVGVALVLSPSDDAALRELHGWMKEHLAEYQLPIRWYVLDEIPRTSRGKVNRARVAEACGQRAPVDLHRLLAGAE